MFFKTKKAEKPRPGDVQIIVTEGFSTPQRQSAATHFIEAEKSLWDKYVLYATMRYTTNGQPGFRRQILSEHEKLEDTLSAMAEWEQQYRSQYAVHGQPTWRSGPHYTQVAKQMGIAVGPDMVSRRHARRMKHVIAARRKAAQPG